MKKIALFYVSLLTLLPVISFAASCRCPSYHYNYTGSINGHDATINKTQTFQSANNTCAINSVITVNAFFTTKVVNQSEMGTCYSSTLASQTFSTDQSGSTQAISLNSGEFGPLFFAFFLSNAVIANNTVCPDAASVFIKDKLVPMQCTQINPNATVTTNTHQNISATSVVYTALDKSRSLTYAFSNDGQGVMLSAASPTSSVVINSYP